MKNRELTDKLNREHRLSEAEWIQIFDSWDAGDTDWNSDW